MSEQRIKQGIMQPYFFPYLGYFSLIKATDKWIVFDTPQYVRHSWINRNRIIHPNGEEWMFLTLPVKKHKQAAAINTIQVYFDDDWRKKTLDRLVHYYKKAPYFSQVQSFLVEAFNFQSDNLSQLNIHLLKTTCDYIGIEFDYIIFSELELEFGNPLESDEWAAEICKSLGSSFYINAIGGREFFRKELFRKHNIELKFLEFHFPVYNQSTNTFMPGLSVLDVMMFNTPEQINEMLNNYKLVD